MGFAGYFLIVWDFINWAKRNGIPVGPGRGSGAGSVAAWALRITNIDPLLTSAQEAIFRKTVVVFNPLGFARGGLVEAEASDPAPPASSGGLEQASAEGGRLFLARVPSLGYAAEEVARRARAAIGQAAAAPPRRVMNARRLIRALRWPGRRTHPTKKRRAMPPPSD